MPEPITIIKSVSTAISIAKTVISLFDDSKDELRSTLSAITDGLDEVRNTTNDILDQVIDAADREQDDRVEDALAAAKTAMAALDSYRSGTVSAFESARNGITSVVDQLDFLDPTEQFFALEAGAYVAAAYLTIITDLEDRALARPEIRDNLREISAFIDRALDAVEDAIEDEITTTVTFICSDTGEMRPRITEVWRVDVEGPTGVTRSIEFEVNFRRDVPVDPPPVFPLSEDVAIDDDCIAHPAPPDEDNRPPIEEEGFDRARAAGLFDAIVADEMANLGLDELRDTAAGIADLGDGVWLQDVSNVASQLSGGPGDDALQGARGDDQFFGGAGDDSLRGGDNDDALYGGSGDDVINGRDGDDILFGGGGENILRGGAGTDTVSYQGRSGPVTASLSIIGAQDVGGSVDQLEDIENLIGTASGADTLTGDDRANVIDGGGNPLSAGTEVLDGRGGDDIIILRGGEVRGTGGLGADDFVIDSAASGRLHSISDLSFDQGDRIIWSAVTPDPIASLQDLADLAASGAVDIVESDFGGIEIIAADGGGVRVWTIPLRDLLPLLADPPVDDAYEVTFGDAAGGYLRIGSKDAGTDVLANDPDGAVLTPTNGFVAGSNGGEFRISGNGAVDFRDLAGEVRPGEVTSIEYRTDGGTATVTVTVVEGLPLAPVDDAYAISSGAASDAYVRLGAGALGTGVLANDPAGTILTPTNGFVTGANGGEFRISANGSIDFRDLMGEVGIGETTSIVYQTDLGEATATVAVVAVEDDFLF